MLQLGGALKSGLVAFDSASGALAGSALLAETKGDSASYTMAVPATIGGERQLVVTGHDRTFAVRAEDGALVWSHALGEAEEPTRAPLVLAQDRVLVGARAETPPSVVGRRIFVRNDEEVVAVDVE